MLLRRCSGGGRRSSGGARALARRPWLAVLAVALLSAGGCAAVALLLGMPLPSIGDEFSYLLAADTFIRGRLANAAHPMAAFFETTHVVHQPTYASKFPPAQGAFLALGRLVGGHPAVGVWISCALMCGSITWMLQAWGPRRWALLGGVIAVVQFGFIESWAQSYWGGAVAASGGALMIGGMLRLDASRQRPRPLHAAIMALGIVMLAHSRPWEGFVCTLAAAAWLAAQLLGRGRPPLWSTVVRVALPALAVLLLGAVLMAAHNRAVTGRVTRLPHLHYELRYSQVPLFLFNAKRPAPVYETDGMRRFYTESWSPELYDRLRSPGGFVKEKSVCLGTATWRYVGPAFALPVVLALPRLLRGRRSRIAITVIAAVAAGDLLTTYFLPHYLAPIAGLAVAVEVEAVRIVSAWIRRPAALRHAFVWGLVLATLASRVPGALRQAGGSHAKLRAGIERDLVREGGRHLVLVHDAAAPSTVWVRNLADIDGQPVVWAHDLESGRPALLEHFAGRQVWRVTFSLSRVTLARLADP